MKSIKNSLFLTILLSFNAVLVAQEEEIIEETINLEATFDGQEFDVYNFSFINNDYLEDSISFDYVEDDVLKEYDLSNREFIGSKFQITYTETITKEVDDEGEEQESIKRSITKLSLID